MSEAMRNSAKHLILVYNAVNIQLFPFNDRNSTYLLSISNMPDIVELYN